MENQEVYIGKIYRHFKGNYYFVENIAYDSETQERLVVYKPIYNRTDDMTIWVRPEKMFLSEIQSDRKDNITKQNHRFELCTDLMENYIK